MEKYGSTAVFVWMFIMSAAAFSIKGLRADDLPNPVEGLSWTFYSQSCPNLESIVNATLDSILEEDISQAAGLLRLHFHDCFVQGCDASVLLNGSASDPSEQDAPPNLTLRAQAFKIINDIKAAVEAACSGIVSCADILTLAARDSIRKAGGPAYAVPLGRRDSLDFANESVTVANIPSPRSNVSVLMSVFGAKGFSLTDLVALSGGHTIGIGHCSSFTNRLYPTQVSTIDQTFAKILYSTCPTNTTDNTTNLDILTPNVFDNKYYVNQLNRQVLFTSDETLYFDNSTTRSILTSFAINQAFFFQQFVVGMFKMGQLGVLTGSQGEIRKNCSVPNSSSSSYSEPSIYSIINPEESSSYSV
eukprot:Gb_37292 [translate_table: standard]